MKINIKNKKGIAAMTFIIGIIILLLCAAVLYGFYIAFGGVGQVDRQACAQSVLIRGTLPDLMAVKAKEYAPLNCKTQKFCVTDKIFGSDCEEFKGEKYTKVKVSGNPSKMNAQINAFLAKEAAECWSMMGQGKLQIFTRPTFKFTSLKNCVICDRIAFGKSVKSKMNNRVVGLSSYMITHFVPNTNPKISYADFVFGGLGDVAQSVSIDVIELNEKVIVYRELGKTTLDKWAGAIGGGSAALYFGGAIGCGAGKWLGGVIGTFVIPVPVVGTAAGAGIGCATGVVTVFVMGVVAGKATDDAVNEALKNAPYLAGESILDNSKTSFDENKIECDSFEDIP